MIKVNGQVIEINKFPDGTPRINVDALEIMNNDSGLYGEFFIEWKYESNDEAMYLMLIKKHIEDQFPKAVYRLFLPYIPNARMDRVKYSDEVFSLKWFCDFINWLNFDVVDVLDVHSDVSAGLLNHCNKYDADKYLRRTLRAICNTNSLSYEEPILYFPDSSAAKRYSDLFPELLYCYGEKKRDWITGKILGLDIRTNDIDLKDETVLMVDDIISYGGSMKYGADKLKELGANKIYAYATHTENSVLDHEKGTLIKSLENGTVERLFTTNSLFTGKHEKITVMEVSCNE